MIFPANILESMVYSMDVTGMQVLGALFTALVVCAALGPVMIPALHKLKFGQSIRDVGPASHMKKSGTPTMGGIMMLCGLFIAMLVWNRFTPLIIIAFVLTFGHALIGFLDDYIKVVMKRNLGLTAKQKLALQIALAMAYIYYKGEGVPQNKEEATKWAEKAEKNGFAIWESMKKWEQEETEK